MEHFRGSQVSWGTEPQFLRGAGKTTHTYFKSSLLPPSAPLRGLLFALVVLTVPSIEGGGTGTEGPQHAGAPVQAAGCVELLT